MKLLVNIIIMLCGLMVTSAYAETTPTGAKNTTKTVSAANLDRDSVCTNCHDENESKPILSIYQTAHGNKADSRTPSCQGCHGESEKHLSNKSAAPDVIFGTKKVGSHDPSEPKNQNKACLTCHDKDPKRTHWEASVHQASDVACTSCHETHTAHDKVRDKKTQPDVCFACHKDQRSQINKFSHHPIGEGKVACSDCHNPHGSAGPKLLNKNTVTETCYTCHADKRGPFLWEHQPVTEDCTNCHTPHGSNITPLLKSRAPFMCQECHDGPHQSKTPAAGNVEGTQGGLTSVPNESFTGRACMNCHSMVHGSNHPAGALLQR
jgi:DmsE family decaheme c-type cytochrome